MDTFLALVGMFISVVLIGIILLQRGRGGGLVGALSGLGGQSAFGTKAGDTFTRITIVIAAFWVLLAGVHGIVLRGRTEKFKNDAKQSDSLFKDKEPSVSSTKSGDPKKGAGLGVLSNDDGEDGAATDTPKSKKAVDAKDDTSDDSKKTDSEVEKTDDKKPSSESKPEPSAKPDNGEAAEKKSSEKSDESK